MNFCRHAANWPTKHQAALVFDEIQCGMGRTGRLFAFEHFGVVPDVVCIAKPMAAGFPMGAFLSKDWLAQHITPGRHGTTFGGGPLACRIALEYLAILEEENLLEQVQRVGAYLNGRLQELVAKFSIATEVRGVGMMQALQLDGSRQAGAGRRDGRRSAVQHHARHHDSPAAAVPAGRESTWMPGVRILKRHLAAAQKAGKASEGSGERLASGTGDVQGSNYRGLQEPEQFRQAGAQAVPHDLHPDGEQDERRETRHDRGA